jgi:hypothetical protein
MKTHRLLNWASCLFLLVFHSSASSYNPNTDWFKEARYGVFMHFLPADAAGLGHVSEFDVEHLARQLDELGAKYFVITLGQNSGFFNAPNSVYNQITGYTAGERCATRDLPLALSQALQPKSIKLMLYLPCQTPNEDARAQKAFGFPQGKQDQPVNLEFARQWARVIQEWSDRYGDKVAGWWFDGAYEHIQFNDAIAEIYAQAAKHGNPNAIVTFNPGVKLVRHTQAEDYTAGELNEPFATLPSSRWVNGSQWHALTYLGANWSQRDTRFPTDKWARWVSSVVVQGGVVTLDMGPNWNPQSGPIGSLADAQVAQVKAVQSQVRKAAETPHPKRLTRAESFLGIHFDFHAGPDCKEIGKNTTRGMIENIIDQVRPDYLQIDCKGHAGFSSYPTQAGNQAPGFVGDPLRLWRQVTAERGVSLYMHYSGVWDSEAIRKHPDWAVINADGATNINATSFFGAYAEQLLIPQLRELSGDYHVDGAWIDGECWASMPDYGSAALKAFRDATSILEVPRKPGDPHWFEFLQFNRDAFRNYLRHYLAEVKRTNPDMQLCSNWAFTDHMPEPVSAPVDFISGDYSPEDSVNSARLSARYLARQGKPWDLMAWSFAHPPGAAGSRQKSAVQLQREAAVVLALGGGFQAYFTQRRDGSVREEQMPVMAEVARFCRARQAICHHAIPVPQVALLYSTAAHYREVNGLFARDLSRLQGTLQALLESQQSVEVLGEHHLTGRMNAYPLIIVPECDYLEPAFKQELVEYAKGGGSLLLIGPKTDSLFAAELGIALEDKPLSTTRYLDCSGQLVSVKGQIQTAKLSPKARPFGQLHLSNELTSAAQPAASVTKVGRGKMAALYFTFSKGYLGDHSPLARAFLNNLTRELFPSPMVEVRGSTDVDVTVNRLAKRLTVNLVNTAGPHADLKNPIIDSIPSTGPLEILIRTSQKPKRLTLEPDHQPLTFAYRRGECRLTLPRLEIHSVIVVE